MDPYRDPYASVPPQGPGSSQPGSWRWKTVDIVALVVLFVVFWPLGLAFLVWKVWNDRQPYPKDVETVLRGAGARVEEAAEKFGSMLDQMWSGAATSGARTGNAAFDAYIAQKEAALAEQRRALNEEIEAFRRFQAQQHSGDHDLYERFRSSRTGPAG